MCSIVSREHIVLNCSNCLPPFMKANEFESCKILIRARNPDTALFVFYKEATALGGTLVDINKSSDKKKKDKVSNLN
jgi:hypothetical protein